MTGIYTGRSPKDKFIVMDDNSKDTVWWTSDEFKNELLLCGGDEHVLYKMGLPCHFHDEADGHTGVGSRAWRPCTAPPTPI